MGEICHLQIAVRLHGGEGGREREDGHFSSSLLMV